MKKLELKHLAPYLPYELIIDSDKFEDNRVMGGMVNDHKEVSIDAVFRCQYKPILRPLSDLTEDVIKEMYNDNDVEVKIMKHAIVINYRLMGDSFKDIISLIKYNEEPQLTMPTWLYYELLKKHFDIFGLIEKGLAIDVNTIK